MTARYVLQEDQSNLPFFEADSGFIKLILGHHDQ